MQDRWYLLTIAQLGDATLSESLKQRCLRWLDLERQKRLDRLQLPGKQAEMIGAGLLVQLAVNEMLAREKGEISEQKEEEKKRIWQVSEVLDRLEQLGDAPFSLEYTYGEWGKPFFKNLPYYFNLSHSGEYILCVISTQEIGVDIQWEKPLKNDRLARRYFTEEEKENLSAIQNPSEWCREFYRIWATKEAYGKLTGKGLTAVLRGEPEEEKQEPAIAVEGFGLNDYQIVVCKWK